MNALIPTGGGPTAPIPRRSRPARRRVSLVRLFLVVAVAVAVTAGGSLWAVGTVRDAFTNWPGVPFAPYVDVTLTPVMHFEDPLENPVGDVVLAFVVADPQHPCTPTWGTYYDLDAAGRALDLDRRIARLRERGGDVTISFGGALNDELARRCTDVDALTDAYRSVIDRYDVTVVDIDVEGPALGDREADARRATALATLQRERAGDRALDVWLTVPVAPSGMPEGALSLVETTITGGVDLTGVNLMTMNYGGSRPAQQSMADASIDALRAGWQQLDGLHRRLGRPLPSAELWSRLAATPMIGRNDVAADVFAVGDARTLVAFAREIGLGKLSMWSANRDGPCGAQVDSSQASTTCSGVDQQTDEFGAVFAAGDDSAAAATGPPVPAGPAESRDDPATSPYPIWRAAKVYVQDDKVVWHRNVYQAKWWTTGDLPDAPVENLWDTPWRYLGPVLEGDAAAATAAPVPATGLPWKADGVYLAGQQVVHADQLFEARWWTQGDEPREDPDSPYDHPWTYLGDVEPDPG
jgi:chitinase